MIKKNLKEYQTLYSEKQVFALLYPNSSVPQDTHFLTVSYASFQASVCKHI